MKVSRETKIASSLLAKAFIAARAGDEQKAGAYMMAACRTDALDPVMHGVAASMGMDEDDYDDDMEAGCEGEECCAGDEDDYDDMEASDDDSDDDDSDAEEVDFSEIEFDDDGDVEEETDVELESSDDDEVEKTPAKVAVPASCYRLARARY